MAVAGENKLLAHLPPEAFGRLAPYIQSVHLERQEVLFRAQEPLTAVYYGKSFMTFCRCAMVAWITYWDSYVSTIILEKVLEGGVLDLPSLAEKPLFVPETMSLMTLLEQFKRTHLPLALVVDEFGDVGGLVSLTDVITSIVGDLPAEFGEEPMLVRRDDGSWLLDGGLDLDVALRTLDAESLLGDEDRRPYHTVGGLAMLALGRVPRTGDVFDRGDYRFEIVAMDGNRVDRVLVTRIDGPTKTQPSREP